MILQMKIVEEPVVKLIEIRHWGTLLNSYYNLIYCNTKYVRLKAGYAC